MFSDYLSNEKFCFNYYYFERKAWKTMNYRRKLDGLLKYAHFCYLGREFHQIPKIIKKNLRLEDYRQIVQSGLS